MSCSLQKAFCERPLAFQLSIIENILLRVEEDPAIENHLAGKTIARFFQTQWVVHRWDTLQQKEINDLKVQNTELQEIKKELETIKAKLKN